MLKGVMQLVIIASFMVRVFPIRELKPGNYLGITGKTNINFFLCCLKEIEIGHELKKKLSVACEWSVAFFGYPGFTSYILHPALHMRVCVRSAL
jgi:hypothetical protein